MDRIIIIGGLSAGPSAAAKARRENEDAEILLFEKTANISYATCGIPYALSGVIPSRDNLLVVEADLLETRFNIKMHLGEEVLDIRPDEHKIITSKREYDYDKLIYTAGASTIIPPVRNIEKANNWSACRTLADFDHIMQQGVLSDVQHITVMGAGLIGVEVAENLKKIGKDVTLIEGSNHILPMWQPKFSQFAETALEKHGINVISGHYVDEFEVTDGKINKVIVTKQLAVKTDFVIMSVGIRPNTQMLTSKGAEHIGNGALKVNEYMETSLPDIYAAGDCASIKNVQTGEHDYIPLGTHSNKGGRTAGANAVGRKETFVGGYKTAIIKVFNKTMARTGMGPKYMDKNNIPYKTNLIVAGATPSYYPDQKDLIIETYYNPDNGQILGAEMFGEKGVDKRIDVMSTAIYAKLSIQDLPNLDLAYAPPYAPAKDPVIVSGHVTSNVLADHYTEISPEELAKYIHTMAPEAYNLVDVRTAQEAALGKITPHAIQIAVDDLRTNLDQLDKNLPTILYCARGKRGYISSRILRQNGFTNIRNLSGGYKVWEQLQE